MPIRFPRMHIAQSVVNRILNTANQVQPSETIMPHLPDVPDPSEEGEAISAALATPPGDMHTPAGAEAAMLEAALSGTSPADALAIQGVIENAENG